MTFVLVVLVGVVVYVAVKLAKRPQTDPKSHAEATFPVSLRREVKR
jgi:hypothetical protein